MKKKEFIVIVILDENSLGVMFYCLRILPSSDRESHLKKKKIKKGRRPSRRKVKNGLVRVSPVYVGYSALFLQISVVRCYNVNRSSTERCFLSSAITHCGIYNLLRCFDVKKKNANVANNVAFFNG